MEAKKEEDNCLSDVGSITNDEIIPQSSTNAHPKHQNLAVKRNLQIASISPTSHKVQFAVDGHHDFIDDEDSVFNSGAIAHEQAEDKHSKAHNNNNNYKPEDDVFFNGRSPERVLRINEKDKRRKRTLSEASYFSATSTMSAESTLSSSSSSSSYSYYTAPDGGWGWVIVVASFLVNMIADGVTFSFGVLFVEFQNEFGESKAVTAGIVSLFHAVPLLSGPVASALTDRYGCRKMTILGSLLATTGFLLSSVSHSIEMLYLTFGIMSGFGLSLCYVAAVVIVAYYFDRRRSFATGISVCGSGVGTFLFAPLTQYLVEKYDGWRGACVILAGLFLNMCVCGALFRDLEITKKQKLGNKRQSLSNCSSSNAISEGPSMPEIEELRSLLEKGDISTLFSQDEPKDCPRMSSSLVTLPTYITSQDEDFCSIEPLSEDVIHALSRNKRACHLILKLYPDSIIAKSLSDTSLGESMTKRSPSEDPEITKTCLKRKVSSLFKKRPTRSILKKTKHEEQTGQLSPNGKPKHSHPSYFHHGQTSKSMYLNHLRVRRQSLTYRGAMLNINRYRLRASSCPDIYRNSMTTIAQEEASLGFWRRFSAISCCCGWEKFINPSYIFFCLSNFILYAWYDVMYVYLVDYSEKDLGFSSQDATFLISIIGILNTFGEVIIGWLGDQSWNSINLLYAVCMIACGSATAIVPFLSTYLGLGVVAGVFGFAISANYSLTSPILVDLVSLEQFSNAYGLLLLVQGISNLVGPPFAGYLYDVTKKWNYSFGLSGLCIGLSGLLLLVVPIANFMKNICTHSKTDKSVQLTQSPAGPTDVSIIIGENMESSFRNQTTPTSRFPNISPV